MMRFITPLFTLLSLLLITATAVAESPNYNYTELSYSAGEVKVDLSPEQQWDQEGFEIEGSYAYQNNIWVYGSYNRLDGRSDLDTSKLDSRNAILRLGYVFSPTQALSLDVSALLRKDRYKQFLETSRGWGVGAGVRARLAMFELFGRADYLGKDFDGGWAADTGLVWYISTHFGLTLSYEVAEYKPKPDSDVKYQPSLVQLGLRFTFPRSGT